MVPGMGRVTTILSQERSTYKTSPASRTFKIPKLLRCKDHLRTRAKEGYELFFPSLVGMRDGCSSKEQLKAAYDLKEKAITYPWNQDRHHRSGRFRDF